MAPNRKQITTLLSSPADWANLQSTIQPKFLPLTHPKEEQEYVQREQQEQAKAVIEPVVASYWDWPTETPHEETKKDLFTVSNLESNLIQASNSIAAESSSTLAANDNYWAEAEASTSQESKPAACTKPQQLTALCYWDWETTTAPSSQDSFIQKIVQEHKAHRIVSASLQAKPDVVTISQQQKSGHCTQKKENDQYWSWESPVTAPHALDANHPLANYWDEATDNSDKTMIEHLTEYEHARQVLSADRVVQVMMHHPITSTSSSVTNASSEAYWFSLEPLGDAYWDTTVTAAAPAVACGGAGYWDM